MMTIAASFLALILLSQAPPAETEPDFYQPQVQLFLVGKALPDAAVSALEMDNEGRPIVAAGQQLLRFSGDAWLPLTEAPFVPSHLVLTREDLCVARDDVLARFHDNEWTQQELPEKLHVTCLYGQRDSAGIIAGTPAGLYYWNEGTIRSIPSPPGAMMSFAVAPGNALAAGTDHGLFQMDPATAEWLDTRPAQGQRAWALRDVGAVSFGPGGALAFAAGEWIGLHNPSMGWRLFSPQDGVPVRGYRMVTSAPDGTFWFATSNGVVSAGEEGIRYWFSRRWLPSDDVVDIAAGADGIIWIATTAGVARLQFNPMTLLEKALHFQEQVETRHVRDGFIVPCRLAKRYETESTRPEVTDNDGLYTAMYGAAQAFRFAATGEPAARELARRSFDACKRLVDITGTGMPARVIVPADWPEPLNEQYGEEYNRRKRLTDPLWKQITPRFVPTPDGKWLWKCDTSSDELVGHYFLYGVFHDLAADAQEKEMVAGVVRAVTDHLIDNGFLLRDHDGEPTRWGNFSPSFLNSPQGWEQRGLNSLMMLAFLQTATHITGDEKYAKASEYLREKHNYHINAMQSKMYFPPEYVVPWDNNLCLMSWYLLLHYESDASLQLQWRLAMEHAWRHISRQKNPFWNLLFDACSRKFNDDEATGRFENVLVEMPEYRAQLLAHFKRYDAFAADTLATLRGIPLDLIGYRMDNSQRLDVAFDPERRGREYGWSRKDNKALPIEQRGHVRLDRDAFELDLVEGDGHVEHEGTFFLLPYWLGIYHGAL